jgi:uncharacterized protein
MYHDGQRRMQDRFDSRRIADRLEEVTVHAEFTPEDKTLIEGARQFFLATSNADGEPECSYKGGDPGFVRVTSPQELAFPCYDGNGMFRSFGNVAVNPRVQLLFVDFEDPDRLRVSGTARVSEEDSLLPHFEGAQFVVRVAVTRIFPNCPRYIHKMRFVEASPYVPRNGKAPPVPAWKGLPEFRDHLPRKTEHA